MFRTKAEVDRHVSAKLAKLPDRERAARSYSFAQLYYSVGDYESCRRYVQSYLNGSENNAAARTLLGNTLIKLGNKEKALEELKISYELDSTQKNLILTVCELLSDPEVEMDRKRAEYWWRLGEALGEAVGHPAVFALKERALGAAGGDAALLALLRAEAALRPLDAPLHARLLRCLGAAAPRDACAEAARLELHKGDGFQRDFAWYETLRVINLSESNRNSWEYHLLNLIVLDKICTLSLLESTTNSRKSLSECAAAINELDSGLFAAQSVRGLPELVKEFVTFFKGQLCLHAASFLLKKGKRELLIWRDAVKWATPLLALAYHCRPPEEKPAWSTRAPEHTPQVLQRWSVDASYRCSQAGHVLQNCVKDNRRQLLIDKMSQTCADPQWRHKIHSALFEITKSDSKTSFIVQNLGNPDFKLPKINELRSYDEKSQLKHPDSLHCFVWLGLNNSLADLHCTVFGGLAKSIHNMSNCSVETLTQIDMDAFLYCAIIAARQKLTAEESNDYKSSDRPFLILADLTDLLCSIQQMKFWELAHRSVKGAGDALLVRGIEVIRCVGDHGLPPDVLCSLGAAFSDRANASKQDKEILEERAAVYYAAAIPLLRHPTHYQSNHNKKRLFEYNVKSLSSHKIDGLLEEANLFIGIRYMNDGEDEKAINALQSVKSPYGSFHLFQIYKRLSDEQTDFSKESVTSEMRSKRITLLSKARQAAYLTLERIKTVSNPPKKHPLYADLQEQLQLIELKLCRIDLDVSSHSRNECDGKYSSDDDSSKGSLNDHAVVNSSLYVNASSTPKQNSRLDLNSSAYRSMTDSKRVESKHNSTRLEYQIKHLHKKEFQMANFVEHTKEWLESNRDLADEVRNLKKTVNDLKSINLQDTIDQFKVLKISIDQIRDRMNEHRDESKSEVRDLKKEVSELKREMSKVKVQSGEYFEDETGARLPFPNFAQRMPGIPPLHPMYNMQHPFFMYPQPPLFDRAYPFGNDQNLYPDITQLVNNAAATPQVRPPASEQPSVSVPKSLPLNVVITSSDPLPTRTTTPQMTLSVTIPPEHIKGSTPHSYQIEMPTSTVKSTVPTFGSPSVSTPKSSSSIFGTPSYFETPNAERDKSRTLSEKSNTSVEYDPCPDFKPIIALPDEVKLTTGEEDETVIFKERAKLFRFTENQWKERGTGEVKLLRNNSTGKVRLLMRREQVHKICANHLITNDMRLLPMKDQAKAYTWVANDFAEEVIVLETFCIRFKTVDIAKEFFSIFNKVRDAEKSTAAPPVTIQKPANAQPSFGDQFKPKTGSWSCGSCYLQNEAGASKCLACAAANPQSKDDKKTFGGLTFTTAPTFKPVAAKPEQTKKIEEKTTVNPFSTFKFATTAVPAPPKTEQNDSLNASTDQTEEFVPTAEFKPVIPLPALVESKTGEENEQVLFEHNAKLLRYVSVSKEWKERGLGIMKLLRNPVTNKIRLLMRRQQIFKICCNHNVTKDMEFHRMPKKDTAVTWSAEDFSEAVSTRELFCLRFKTSDICNDFLNAIEKAKANLTETTEAPKTKTIPETGFGDKFKPKSGSWSCALCYVSNGANALKCVACGNGNPNATVPAPEKDSTDTAKTNNKVKTVPETGFGDKFKPKAGSWSCSLCYVNNNADASKCLACGNANPNAATSAPEEYWTCLSCNTKNDNSKTVCILCSVVKGAVAEPAKAAPKFTFGIPAAAAPTSTVFSFPVKNSTIPQTVADFKPTFSFGSEKTPFAENKTPFTENKTPFTENKTPFTENKTPFTENKTPFTENKTPFTENKTPFTENKTPFAENKTLFTENKTLFTENKAPFSEIKAALLTEKKTPFTENKMPFAESKTPFAENKTPFTQSKTLFADPKMQSFAPENTMSFSFTPQKVDPWNSIQKMSEAGLVTPMKKEDGSVSFSVNTAGKFDFHLKAKSPGKSPKSDKGDGSGDEYASEDEGEHIHFTPIIPLPEKVEVVTGEEDEEVLSVYRAKLYRFVGGEYKERGLGDVKILRHTENKKLRVLMRREQVLKICLNHALTVDTKYNRKDDKTWLFSAHDYSEGQLALQQFCLRFKTKEIAEEFKEDVDKALQGAGKKVEKDIEVVAEVKPSSEDIELSRRLMLPDSFFNYKKEKCAGCRGCNDDDFVFPVVDMAELDRIHSAGPLSEIKAKPISTPSRVSFKLGAEPVFSTPTAGNKSDIDVFSTPNLKTPVTNIFALKAAEMNFGATPKNVFSAKNDTPTLFNEGAVTITPVKSEKPTKVEAPPGGVFSFVKKDSEPETIFGWPVAPKTSEPPLAATTAASVFGASGPNIFSKPNFGTTWPGLKPATNTSTTSPFQTFNTGVTVFGSNATMNGNIFQGQPLKEENKLSKSDAKENAGSLFKVDDSLLFSSLAAEASSKAEFAKSDNFTWEGAGQQLFTGKGATSASKSNKPRDKTKGDSDEESGDEKNKTNPEEEHDPHFEPLVPLPDVIVVSTGEENEEVLFCERGKLYRYDDDTKQWKERGVGNIKLLHDPQRFTYRLILRRDQVHKVVLNQLVTSKLELLPMANSENAWTWAGLNYTEEKAGTVETLAVRFKLNDTAATFKEQIDIALKKLANSPKKLETTSQAIPTVVTSQSVSTASSSNDGDGTLAVIPTTVTPGIFETVEVAGENCYLVQEEDEHDDYDYYENDEGSIMCSMKCDLVYVGENINLSDVMLQVIYDQELLLGRIVITDNDGLVHTNMLILQNYDITMNGLVCVWEGPDDISADGSYPVGDDKKRTLEATFLSESDVLNFHTNYMECLSYAKESHIPDIEAEED